MFKELLDLEKDLSNFELPTNIENVDKIKTPLIAGKRVWWYYEEDLEYFDAEGEDIKNFKYDIYSGIVVPIFGHEYVGGELGFDECVLVIDRVPTEKEYPTVAWITMSRLLEDSTLVEVFE